jgi:hypothetical protein
MTPGQLIDALVLEFIDATTVRLAVADSVIEVKTDIPLVPGAHVRLAVRGHGDNIHWVIVGAGSAPATPRAEGPVRTDTRAPAHPAAPATEVTIGGAAAVADADIAASSQVKSEPAQGAQRVRPAEPNPQVEFANATRLAVARQSGLAPLFAELKTLVSARDVPVQVKQIAAQVLTAPVALDVPSGDVLKAGNIAVGLVPRSAPCGRGWGAANNCRRRSQGCAAHLETSFARWLDAMPPSLHVAPKPETVVHAPPLAPGQSQTDIKPPPPYRGAPTSGQPAGRECNRIGRTSAGCRATLLTHTDGALSRQVLMQVASLPDAAGGVVPSHADGTEVHWTLEVPFVTPQGTAIAQFEIQRDARRSSPKQAPAAAWRANFSLDFEPMGPIHAQIALTGKRAAVTSGPSAPTLRQFCDPVSPNFLWRCRLRRLMPATWSCVTARHRVRLRPVRAASWIVRHDRLYTRLPRGRAGL